MNRQRTQFRECTRKDPYRTNQAAQDALWRIVRNTGTWPGRLHTYRCNFGDHFHVGRRSIRSVTGWKWM